MILISRHLSSFVFVVFFSLFFCSSTGSALYAQQRQLIHSHNDYEQRVPFYQAYAQEIFSIEADIFSQNGQLLVAHNKEDLPTAPSIETLYIEPLVRLFSQHEGRAWKASQHKMQLLIDLKTPVEETLPLLVQSLSKYPDVFDPAVNPMAVRIVISGNRPAPASFHQYPSFIFFDGEPDITYTDDQLKRIGLISASFANYSEWNGKGSLIASEKAAVQKVIDEAHAQGKMIRFWGSPDYITAWSTFHAMGVDIINTDRIEACADFFRDFDEKQFGIGHQPETGAQRVVKTDRLDKTTADFSGFDEDSRKLSHATPVYQPTYRNDGANTPIKNVILLIGDGMGLAHICATDLVNGGLSFLNLRHIGLQKTSSKDAYTTDSAGAGSSIATGQSNKNRHISMREDGIPYPTIPEKLAPKGIACGVVTLGNIADATPAAFYGHTRERNNTEEIIAYLPKGMLTLLAGSGADELGSLRNEIQKTYGLTTSIDSINLISGKVICLDERMAKAASEKNLPLLANTTKQAIEKLSANKQGFFLMVEGAKIDYAGHANSVPGAVVETLSFDLAVAEALKFADSNGETLVIVTADHETGGLTLIDGDRDKRLITARFMTDDHTPIMVPVFAYGPGAQHFNGVYPNTQIFSQIINSFN